jgi:hypothetical protein
VTNAFICRAVSRSNALHAAWLRRSSSWRSGHEWATNASRL